MKAYIQAPNGVFMDDWAFAAYCGFSHRMKVHLYDHIDDVPLDIKNIILVGCIEDTQLYFKRNNVSIPEALNIPKELYLYCQRYVRIGTINDFVTSNDLGIPVFVKPLRLKEFPAGVVTKQKSINTFFLDLDPTTPALWSSYLDIVSEYRGFVIDGKIVGLKHYQGDFTVFPKTLIIEQAIQAYKNAPAGYTIDFGVTANGKTVLIECNDGWSIGNYGLDAKPYCQLLMKRWQQIIYTK